MDVLNNIPTPEPLVPDLPAGLAERLLRPVVSSRPGKYIQVDDRRCLNAATHDYLNLADSPRIVQASLKSVRHYGVGSCGPRAFYGTMDVHLELESQLASFLGVQEVALYSYGFSTIASAIPAYAKASDVVLYDEQCNFAIQKGITASRSRAIKFKHNDASDLEAKLTSIELEIEKGKSKRRRTFLIIEGVYAKTGTVCVLPQLVDVARRHKTRLFIDESHSFGILGRTGRGVTEALDVEIDELDLIMVSLERALCSYGGFCAGSSFIIDHQRLAGSGYCFSASLPPFQCSSALEALKMIEDEPERLARAQEMSAYAQVKLAALSRLENLSHEWSPIKVLVVRGASLDSEFDAEQLERLERICDDILENELIALTVARHLDDEEATKTPASIRLTINASMTREDVDRVLGALERHSSVHL